MHGADPLERNNNQVTKNAAVRALLGEKRTAPEVSTEGNGGGMLKWSWHLLKLGPVANFFILHLSAGASSGLGPENSKKKDENRRKPPESLITEG